MKKILIVFIFVFLFVGFLHPITSFSQDLGRHLLIGEIISKTGDVPKVNLLSYTHTDFQFVNHHWLSEVFYYFIVSIFGLNGLLILSVSFILLAFALVFFYSYKRYAFIPLLVVSFLSIQILLERTDLRPEMISFLFFSSFITILFLNREKFTRLIFILPFIELLWVNIHIYFITGIMIVGLFLIDDVLKKRKELIKGFKKHQIPKTTTWLFLILTLCGITTIMNPNGIQGTLYPLNVFKNYGYTIVENQTIFFLWNYVNHKTTVYFLISFFLVLLSLLITIKKSRPIDWLLTIVFGYLATQAIRNFPLFVFAAFIPFARSLSILYSHVKMPHISHTPLAKMITATLILFFIFWHIIAVSSTRTIGLGVEKGAEKALDFFEKNNLKGPIFNNFDIGSYIAYRLYPKEKVFVDGRPEAYPKEFFSEIYKSMQLNHDVFQTHEKTYKFNTIIFSHTDQTEWGIIFLQHIVNDSSWKVVFLDDSVIILVKDNAKNKVIIQKFAFDQKSFKPTLQTSTTKSLLQMAAFFQKVGWIDKQIEIFQELLERNPQSCVALYQLAQITLQTNDPSSMVYVSKFNSLCK